jgi:hypothetical protein
MNTQDIPTTGTGWRALCEELADELTGYKVANPMHCRALLDRARADLAQPEPAGLPPRVGHILRLAEIIREVDGNHDKGAAALAEAILSHPGSRWQSSLAQPEPVGPTDEEIEEWADAATEVPLEEMDPEVHGWRRCFTAKEFSETIRAALARWGRPAIQPVPVADPEAASQWPAHWSRAQREREAQSLCLQAGIDPVQQKRLCRYARDGMPLQDIHDLIAAEPDSRPSQEDYE